MKIETIECELLLRPHDQRLRFLPEGPYPVDDQHLSWVSIQHGVEATTGSLNILDLSSSVNRDFTLPGRPGFAFPTNIDGKFLIGLEREVGVFDVATNDWRRLVGNVDAQVDGTIINDGVVCNAGVIFGCKDLQFKENKAGLYFYRASDNQLFQLRDDQLCSNGKVILQESADIVQFLDIDTPTKKVVRYELDCQTGKLSAGQTVLDLNSQSLFPDGMIATPDGSGVIIAMFNSDDCPIGEARQYDLTSGACLRTWQVADSPQVTCPQLVKLNGRVKLVLTTAAENMSEAKLQKHPNAGCLFVGETDFTATSPNPRFAQV
jgi:sugar lactone lactonase YvrE